MRVLLINPAIRPEQFGRFASLLEAMPCIGVAYIGTFLSRAGHDVRIYDDFALRGGEAEIQHVIERFQPNAIGVSVLTPVAPAVYAMLGRIRGKWPEIRLFAGNIHPDLFPEEALEYVDAVVHGEGEQASVELLEAWSNGKNGAGIPGISVLDGGRLESGPERALEKDLDSYPFPNWDLLPVNRYSLLPLGTVAKPIVAVAASRGCPYRCT